MTQKKISQLTETKTLKESDVLPIVQDGENKKVSYETVKNQLSDDVESGIKDNLKDSIKQDIRDDIKQSIQDDIKQDVDNSISSNISQKPGDSETATMSQKAIGKAIKDASDALDAKITSNSNATTQEVQDREAAITALAQQIAQDLQNYYAKTEVDAKISQIPKFAIAVVETLPTTNISNTTVYLVKSGSDDANLYTEYIYVNEKWEKLGEQTVDLTDYYTKAEADARYATLEAVGTAISTALNNHYTKTEADTKFATKEMMDTAIEEKIGNINTVLEKINTGEGV